MRLPERRFALHRSVIKAETGKEPKGWPGRNVCALGGLVLAAAFVYFPAIQGGWLWDDGVEVAQNPLLKRPAGLIGIWAGSQGDDYFPLKTSLQWIQCHLWGDRVAGYHLASIGLHLLSALLLWRLLHRLG